MDKGKPKCPSSFRVVVKIEVRKLNILVMLIQITAKTCRFNEAENKIMLSQKLYLEII